MKVHLVGGFTGSGKTTAIENARKLLNEKHIINFVFSDKEGEYFLADCPKNQFGDHGDFGDSPDSGAPFARVTGGCFCCNYTQLDSQIELLKKRSDQSVLFADYGGTCTNLISTLLKPLMDYKGAQIELADFSTFIDAKFLLLHLKGLRVPLSLESKYIWEKHLEEAEILIINKIDLLSGEDFEDLKKLANDALSSKQLIYQNSLELISVQNWIELIETPREEKKNPVLKDSNSSAIAWLDEEIQILTENETALNVAYDFMGKLSNGLIGMDMEIQHLKFLLFRDGEPFKLDHTLFLNGSTPVNSFYEKSNSADLMINARVQTSPEELRKFLFHTLNHFKSQDGVKIVEKFISYFE